jgi:hypothetical protein
MEIFAPRARMRATREANDALKRSLHGGQSILILRVLPNLFAVIFSLGAFFSGRGSRDDAVRL